MKVIGILILLAGLLLFVVGAVGAGMNLVFPPAELSCKTADEKLKKAEESLKEYQLAKGTDREFSARAKADMDMQAAQQWSDSCGKSKDSHRFYGIIFLVIAGLGGFTALVGVAVTFAGFRRAKKLA